MTYDGLTRAERVEWTDGYERGAESVADDQPPAPADTPLGAGWLEGHREAHRLASAAADQADAELDAALGIVAVPENPPVRPWQRREFGAVEISRLGGPGERWITYHHIDGRVARVHRDGAGWRVTRTMPRRDEPAVTVGTFGEAVTAARTWCGLPRRYRPEPRRFRLSDYVTAAEPDGGGPGCWPPMHVLLGSRA